MIEKDLIWGETPLEDLSGLKQPFISTRQELIAAEAKNILLAKSKYLSNLKFLYTSKFLFQIHKYMFDQVWDWAGKKRRIDLNIGVQYYKIDEELKNILDDIIYWEQHQWDAIEIIARFHHRLTKLHPFLNGNGRWSRLVVFLYAKCVHELSMDWPEAKMVISSGVRIKYINTLKLADKGSYVELVQLFNKWGE
ncbi:mobile mystery protein B [bacterium]|nr:mobile mystery protein B [bacterium]